MRFFISAVAAVLLLGLPQPAAAQEPASSIVGTWKLTSFIRKEVQTGKIDKYYGERPVGYSVYTRGGTFVTYLIGEGRKRPAQGEMTDAERAELFKGMYAYSGTYKLEANKIFLSLDGSWNESWTGTQRTQSVEIDGNKLTLTSMPFKGAVSGIEIVVINTFERID